MLDEKGRMKDSNSDSKADEEEPFPLTEVDRNVLSQTDEEFKPHSWEELNQIIENDELLLLRRKPSDLRRYIAWTRGIKAQYGSVTEYITQNRLPADWGRPPFTATAAVPFASPSDYVVLINDWPYGLDPGIIHLVVWSRAQILVDLKTGRMTPESQGLVQDFVQNSFVSSLGPGQEDKVTWFKNPVSLQSVRALEHIHVLVRGVDDDTIERWTGRRPPRV